MTFKSILLATTCAAVLCACGTTMPKKQSDYRAEDFGSADTYSRIFPGTDESTCEAARRALLSQGYIITLVKPSQINGRKNFQPDHDTHVQIEFHVVCAINAKGSNTTTAFVNAVRDRYTLKKSSNSASLGVGVLGSVSLPFGSTDDSMVKTGSETIPVRRFYDRFFELMEGYLDVKLDEPDKGPGDGKELDSPADEPATKAVSGQDGKESQGAAGAVANRRPEINGESSSRE
ncbi:DUF2242 domain-containing protein [Noviherbaspirillum galbum]|uniref:DUF2242 domain-containing protein n=1 Tax=Noviherbaspirillum galbum TaxID=2709383 RepID=A0A6B3SQ39_9BURK|nr:DUF2242 domain-containing protein [Noviherbaspirillum galbum]NEX59829.1 DUF2242 domain-containing protein [Noviherbaspirillum galbum]